MMSKSMTVIHIDETSHIVGAITQTVEADAPDLESLIGSDMPLRNVRDESSADAAGTLLLPKEILAAKSVPFDAAVVSNPQNYVVDGGRIAKLPSLNAELPDLNAATITAKYATGPGLSAKTKVMTIVEALEPGNKERRVQSGEFDPAAGTPEEVALNLSILPGEAPAAIISGEDYAVAVAVEGYRLSYFTIHAIP